MTIHLSALYNPALDTIFNTLRLVASPPPQTSSMPCITFALVLVAEIALGLLMYYK